MRSLLAAGADAKRADKERQPLHLAAQRGHEEVVRLLLEANQDTKD